jgi:hypothetical protein
MLDGRSLRSFPILGVPGYLEAQVRQLPGLGTLTSALDAVVHVGDTLPLEDPGALELDVLGTEVGEETAPLARSTGMRWISSSSRTPAASASCAVAAPWTSTFLSPAARLASDIAVLTSFT